MGDKVVTSDGDDLGDLKELLIDPEVGTIAYGVLQLGGVLGVGQKLYAVPWRLFGATSSGTPTLDVDRDGLESAPSFDKDHWPDLESSAWARRVDDYYGQRSRTGKR